MIFNGKEYNVPGITVGCESLGGIDWGNKDISIISNVLIEAKERGFNCFDTADVYGLGRSEERISQIFKKSIKDIFIITKFGIKWKILKNIDRAETKIDLSLDYLDTALHNSLKRLNTDVIPLYLVHWPDKNSSIDLLINQLEIYKKAGKIMNFGISNFTLNDISNETLKKVDAVCNSFSLLNAKKNIPILREAKHHNISSFIYGTLEQGLLSGNYTRKSLFSNNDRRSRLKEFQKMENPKQQNLLSEIRKISEKNDMSMSQVVFKWTNNQQISNSLIMGISTIDQLTNLQEAEKTSLSENDIRLLNKLSNDYAEE
tara:strand:- start:6194 stop:7141 length:948 start_codon:yes stop_codon:yes gene_type:complete